MPKRNTRKISTDVQEKIRNFFRSHSHGSINMSGLKKKPDPYNFDLDASFEQKLTSIRRRKEFEKRKAFRKIATGLKARSTSRKPLSDINNASVSFTRAELQKRKIHCTDEDIDGNPSKRIRMAI